jgi:hypothetical protein
MSKNQLEPSIFYSIFFHLWIWNLEKHFYEWQILIIEILEVLFPLKLYPILDLLTLSI